MDTLATMSSQCEAVCMADERERPRGRRSNRRSLTPEMHRSRSEEGATFGPWFSEDRRFACD